MWRLQASDLCIYKSIKIQKNLWSWLFAIRIRCAFVFFCSSSFVFIDSEIDLGWKVLRRQKDAYYPNRYDLNFLLCGTSLFRNRFQMILCSNGLSSLYSVTMRKTAFSTSKSFLWRNLVWKWRKLMMHDFTPQCGDVCRQDVELTPQSVPNLADADHVLSRFMTSADACRRVCFCKKFVPTNRL